MKPERLDQVGLWSSDRKGDVGRILAFLPGLAVLEEDAQRTVLGGDWNRGKLVLFDAAGPREEEQLMHVAFRLPAADDKEDAEIERAMHVLRLPASEADAPPELDHVAIRVGDPEACALRWKELGFEEVDPRVELSVRLQAGPTFLELYPGTAMPTDRPLLRHVGVLVEAIDPYVAEAGAELAPLERTEGPRSRSLVVKAPNDIQLELIERKRHAESAEPGAERAA